MNALCSTNHFGVPELLTNSVLSDKVIAQFVNAWLQQLRRVYSVPYLLLLLLWIVFPGPVRSGFLSQLGGNRNRDQFFLHQNQRDCNWT